MEGAVIMNPNNKQQGGNNNQRSNNSNKESQTSQASVLEVVRNMKETNVTRTGVRLLYSSQSVQTHVTAALMACGVEKGDIGDFKMKHTRDGWDVSISVHNSSFFAHEKQGQQRDFSIYYKE